MAFREPCSSLELMSIFIGLIQMAASVILGGSSGMVAKSLHGLVGTAEDGRQHHAFTIWFAIALTVVAVSVVLAVLAGILIWASVKGCIIGLIVLVSAMLAFSIVQLLILTCIWLAVVLTENTCSPHLPQSHTDWINIQITVPPSDLKNIACLFVSHFAEWLLYFVVSSASIINVSAYCQQLSTLKRTQRCFKEVEEHDGINDVKVSSAVGSKSEGGHGPVSNDGRLQTRAVDGNIEFKNKFSYPYSIYLTVQNYEKY